MARPIKVTPVLRGKEALRFYAQLEENKRNPNALEELRAIQEGAKKFLSMLTPKGDAAKKLFDNKD